MGTQEWSDALAELRAYRCPEGVDEALLAELKDALGKALVCRVSRETRHGAPMGDNAKMVDGGANVPPLKTVAACFSLHSQRASSLPLY